MTKTIVSVLLRIAVLQALSYPFRSAARLNYSSPSTTVALENCHLQCCQVNKDKICLIAFQNMPNMTKICQFFC